MVISLFSHQWNIMGEQMISFCDYFAIKAPSTGLLRTEIIALLSSPTMLVCFTMKVTSVGFSLERMISLITHWVEFESRQKAKLFLPIKKNYLAMHFCTTLQKIHAKLYFISPRKKNFFKLSPAQNWMNSQKVFSCPKAAVPSFFGSNPSFNFLKRNKRERKSSEIFEVLPLKTSFPNFLILPGTRLRFFSN